MEIRVDRFTFICYYPLQNFCLPSLQHCALLGQWLAPLRQSSGYWKLNLPCSHSQVLILVNQEEKKVISVQIGELILTTEGKLG